jgi:hypothetical protein
MSGKPHRHGIARGCGRSLGRAHPTVGTATLALIGVVVFAVVMSLCWIIADSNRTKHLVMLIRAARDS